MKDPVPQFDLFFYLQADMTNVDGKQRTVTTLRGLSGGPIRAVREIANGELWMPSENDEDRRDPKLRVQGQEKWSKGSCWSTIQQILRQPDIGLQDPP